MHQSTNRSVLGLVAQKLEELTRRVSDLEQHNKQLAQENKELVRRMAVMAAELKETRVIQHRMQAMEEAVARLEADVDTSFCGEQTQQDLLAMCADVDL